MSCSGSVSSRAGASRARMQRVAPICCAPSSCESYSRQPVSSFTSTTKALISVESASRTKCHNLGEAKAQAFTYSALIGGGGGGALNNGSTEDIHLRRVGLEGFPRPRPPPPQKAAARASRPQHQSAHVPVH